MKCTWCGNEIDNTRPSINITGNEALNESMPGGCNLCADCSYPTIKAIFQTRIALDPRFIVDVIEKLSKIDNDVRNN